MRKINIYARFAPLFLILAMLFAACGSSSTGSSNGQNGSGGNSATSASATATGNGGNTPTATATTGKVTVTMVAEIGGLTNDSLNHLAYLGYSKAQQQYGFTSTVLVALTVGDYPMDLSVAAQSANLVIAVGSQMSAPLGQVATQFPNTNFAIVNGCALVNQACKTLPNVAQLSSNAVDSAVYAIIQDDESGNFTTH